MIIQIPATRYTYRVFGTIGLSGFLMVATEDGEPAGFWTVFWFQKPREHDKRHFGVLAMGALR